MSEILYVKAENMIRVTVPEVTVADLGDVWCSNSEMMNQCLALQIFKMNGCRKIVSIIDVVKAIEQQFPEVIVSSLGEQDFVIEYKPKEEHVKLWEYTKFIIIWSVIFLGAAFAIATFNEDVSVTKIFSEVHQMLTGEERIGLTWLEIGYAIGISGGILIFYNHFSKKKEQTDPTPLDVEMRTYEKDLYETMINNTNREMRSQKGKKSGEQR